MNWSLLFSILIGLIGIDILVIIHELGHFCFARMFNVFVEKIQLGFGPSLTSRIGLSGTEYSIGFIPYGAFCRMDRYSLNDLESWKKCLIYFSGPLANIVFSLLCYCIYLSVIGTPFFTSLKLSFLQCINEIWMFFTAVGDIVTGQVKIGDTLSGFLNASINIGQLTRSGFSSGFMIGLETSLWLTASVSVSLAFANLLPIPALDGGFILISLIEMISGKHLSEKFQIIYQITGLLLLLIVFPIIRMHY